MKYEIYTENDFKRDVDNISHIIKTRMVNFDVHLLGLYRGGLPLAVALSNRLNLPLSIGKMQRYDGNDKDFELIYNDSIASNQKIIIIDDIVDEGTTINKTIEYLHEHFPHNKIEAIALYQSTKDFKINCDLVTCNVSSDWVVFEPFGEVKPNG